MEDAPPRRPSDGSAGSRESGADEAPPWPFSLSKLSEGTSVIVEHDRFGEAPHIYVIRGAGKAIIVDTGCGTANLRKFLGTRKELEGLEFQVVNTHIHYDHIMGNYTFCSAGGASLGARCRGICQGARDKGFSRRWQETSLQAMVGASIQSFSVTDWLEEGQRLYLDEAAQDDAEALEVLYTPGHTPDSISLYHAAENRLFTGDLLYPGSIYLFLPGSNLDEFSQSINKLVNFMAEKPAGMTLSCGHITPQLPAESIREVQRLLVAIADSKATPRMTGHPWDRNGEPLAVFETESRMFTLMCRAQDVGQAGGDAIFGGSANQ